MRIAVIGTGYVGLVSAVGFAHLARHDVVCVDTRQDIVDRINRGEAVLYEAGLAEMLRQEVSAGRLRATREYSEAMDRAELALICVGTPYLPNGACDLSFIEQASASIGAELARREDYVVVAVKSTVVPGTTEDLVRPVLERTSGKACGPDFGLGMTPEFLREGVALDDFLYPDRLVLGAVDERSADALRVLYQAHDTQKLVTNIRSAELIKYVANTYLALHISFANEIALLAERIGGVDVREILEGVYLDHRHILRRDGETIRPDVLGYFHPNCGYGGSCFPKDVMALGHKARGLGMTAELTEAITAINQRMPRHLVDRVTERLGGLRGQTVAVLGLAFKPGTDDVRESPSLVIVRELIKRGATVRACDPLDLAHENFKAAVGELHGVTYHTELAEALQGCQAACLATPWPEFDIPAREYATYLDKGALFFDGRTMRDPAEFTAAGLEYDAIGYAKNGPSLI